MNRILTVFFTLATALSSFAQPERDKGLSLHMLPERVARISGEQGGFTVSAPPPDGKLPGMDFKKTFEYSQKLPEPVRRNGIWVVYTHPSSYSGKEKEQLKKLIDQSRERKIPIFTCRASELKKNKWKASGLIE